jgi:hypothetical protein
MHCNPSVEPAAIVWVTFIPRVLRSFAGEIGILFTSQFATKKVRKVFWNKPESPFLIFYIGG